MDDANARDKYTEQPQKKKKRGKKVRHPLQELMDNVLPRQADKCKYLKFMKSSSAA